MIEDALPVPTMPSLWLLLCLYHVSPMCLMKKYFLYILQLRQVGGGRREDYSHHYISHRQLYRALTFCTISRIPAPMFAANILWRARKRTPPSPPFHTTPNTALPTAAAPLPAACAHEKTCMIRDDHIAYVPQLPRVRDFTVNDVTVGRHRTSVLNSMRKRQRGGRQRVLATSRHRTFLRARANTARLVTRGNAISPSVATKLFKTSATPPPLYTPPCGVRCHTGYCSNQFFFSFLVVS